MAGENIIGIAEEKMSNATVEERVCGLRYFLRYKALLKNLYYEIDNLMIMEESVARKVDAERANGKMIHNQVLQWQQDVEDIKAQADELSRETTSSFTCFKVLQFPNPVSRSLLGRKAAHLAKHVPHELIVYGETLMATEIAYDAPDEIVPTFLFRYQMFGSREEAYKKLWEALVNEDGHPIIGVYGMTGVGKTIMIKQAYKEAKDQKIFDKFTQVTVGTEIDVINLQNQLAENLGCHLDSEDNPVFRASQLKNILMNGSKTLIMLDDVRDAIPLNNIGIPFGAGSSKGCKILLTSRNRRACLLNHCKDPIEIKSLTEAEAYEIFKKTVGAKKIQSLHDPSLAEKVCKECAGLPILIQAVGRALKFEDENSWMHALHQMENGEFEEIDPHAYAYFQMSFQKLTDPEKTCLFLCALFPQNAEIEIKTLFDSATGFGLLNYKEDISRYVDILKSYSLLNGGKDDGTVKMNGFIRGVARSTAARDPKYAFSYIRCRPGWPDKVDCASRRLLHLDLEIDDVPFPEKMVCLYLRTLWLHGNNHKQKYLSGFLEAFTNISFMFIKDMNLVEHLLPIRTLYKLRVLILDGCNVDDTFLSSIPDNLDTLTIVNYNLPTRLYLPQLKSLKKLEISAGSTK